MDKEDVLALLRSLVISKNGSYGFTELMRDFEEETGYSLPSFGYKTPLDFLKSIPDCIELVSDFQKIMVKAVNNSKSAHIASLVKRQKFMGTKNKSKSRFSSEIHCNGNISSSKKVNVKQNNSKCTVFADNNFKNRMKTGQSSLLKSSGKKFKSARNEYELDYTLLFNTNDGKCSNVENHNTESRITRIESNFNGNIIKDLSKIPKLNLKYFAETGEYVEVCVPVICNPHNFVIQLRRFKIKLINLMLEIQLFYNKNDNEYRVPASAVRSGLVCVALTKIICNSAQWYRAIVLQCTDKCKVVVGLIDYGTIMEIDINNIRYMHGWFGKLPPQALSGHLANIRPVNRTEWSKESTGRFLNLVYGRDLVAGIVDLNYEELWLSVALSFTQGTELHICDTLVEENLAIFDSSVSVSGPCLPWNGTKGVLPMSQPIPKFLYCAKDVAQLRDERTEEKDHCEANFFSYSESNIRLNEMFLN